MRISSILYKFIVVFIVISVVPLAFFAYFTGRDYEQIVFNVTEKTDQMGRRNLASARTIGEAAIKDVVSQLDKKATEVIELRTVELAERIADFLRQRDRDTLNLAMSTPSSRLYLRFLQTNRKDIILYADQPAAGDRPTTISPVSWSNPYNKTNWHHLPPAHYNVTSKPLYREITFVDLDGMERIKIRDGEIFSDLRDVSRQGNTFCRAEEYFNYANGLKRGELYVSGVVGEYVKGWLYREGEKVKVKEESGYAGKENPAGKRFEGIIRWVTPVFEGESKIGYLTMALDHTHVMEFTDHVVPTEERFSEISDAGSGNYAFLWDNKHQSISHPRDFFICGYDPLTGKEVPGWLSQETFAEYLTSGVSFNTFVDQLPDFKDFSNSKKGAKEQIEAGTVGLDCRVLDHAPQCQGWSRGTEDGGSGSFLIFWSGLWKLTTYAAVPYYTGQYGSSARGFGYVTIGANVEDFHKAAIVTKQNIEETIKAQAGDIDTIRHETTEIISSYFNRQQTQAKTLLLVTVLLATSIAVLLGLTFTRPIRKLIKGVRAIGRGSYNQSIRIESYDEIGELSESFNRMANAINEADQALKQEIKERQKIEEALTASEKRYRDIFESAVEGIFQTSIEGNLLNTNARMAVIFGFSSSEEMVETISSVGIQQYVNPSKREEFVKAALEQGTVCGFEAEMYRRNKEKIWVSINARSVWGDDGQVEYIEGFLMDITQRKQTEIENQDLQRRLLRSKKMEALGLLAGEVAHDLNNVLSGIVSYPDLLLMTLPKQSPMRSLILAIQDSGEKAAAIVQDLLTLARRGVTLRKVVNINDIITDYLVSPEYTTLKRTGTGIVIQTSLASDLFNLYGSAVQLKKTVMNLITNAVEAIPGRGVIHISTENHYIDTPIKGHDTIRAGDYVLLSIEDNGIGINAESVKNIFEPFYTSKIMGRSGTGLGMSVVWGTIQDHNGYINVKSTEGKGTIFELYFPATRKLREDKAKYVPLKGYRGKGESILVIDDVAEQRQLAKALLTKLNYKVRTEPSGESGVKYLQGNSADLVVLDMIMSPGMDGLDTYRKILEINPRQKVVIASGFSEDDRVKEAQQLGAGEYIKKPYTIEKIGVAIKRELSGKGQQNV